MKRQRSAIGFMLGLIGILASGCHSGGLNGFSVHRRPSEILGGKITAQTKQPPGMAEARDLERRGQTDAAMYGYTRIAEKNPEFAMVWHRLAVCYDKAGRRQDAQACYDRAFSIDSENAEVWCDYGYGMYLHGSDQEADRAFRRALVLNPGMQRAHNNLGLVLARLGDSSAALEQFKLAGCDHRQASQNLDLAAAIPVMQRGAMPNVSAPLKSSMASSVAPVHPPTEASAEGHFSVAAVNIVEHSKPNTKTNDHSRVAQKPVDETADWVERPGMEAIEVDESKPVGVTHRIGDVPDLIHSMSNAQEMQTDSDSKPAMVVQPKSSARWAAPVKSAYDLAPSDMTSAKKPTELKTDMSPNAESMSPTVHFPKFTLGDSAESVAKPKEFSEMIQTSFRDSLDDGSRVLAPVTDLQSAGTAGNELNPRKSGAVRRIGDLHD